MISLLIDRLFQIEKTHGLRQDEFKAIGKQIPNFLKKIHKRNQGFYTVIDDEEILNKIEHFVSETKGRFDDIVVLGIGGSALGTLCIQQSLQHLFQNEHSRIFSRNNTSANSSFAVGTSAESISKKTIFFNCPSTRVTSINETDKQNQENQHNARTPRLYVIDNVDPTMISDVEDMIEYSKTLFIVVTKSATTPETLAQYFYFRKKCEEHLKKKGAEIHKHFVFITDPKKVGLEKKATLQEMEVLRKMTKKDSIKTFDIPPNVGGRFSVFTAVGLVPARLIGIDIKRLIQGAKDMRDLFLKTNFEKNPAFQLAMIQYLLSKKGKSINVLMPYSQRLIRFSDWFRQLLAESIGKNGRGLTPLHSLGVTDQHSQSQLYNEGPNDKFFMFIKVKDFGVDMEIPMAPKLAPYLGNHEDSKYLENVTFQKLMHTEMEGTLESLTKNNRPSITLEIDRVDEYHLGSLFMLFEAATAFLGEFFEIDAFNQPGVELSKKITKKLLESQK